MNTEPQQSLSPEALAHYANGREAERLVGTNGQLELARTQELISRFAPPPPAVIFDVGGGAGVYSLWLAKQGYEVHLVDAVPVHVQQAQAASDSQREHPIASCVLGDARRVDRPDESVNVVLMLGPLYHLTERADRLTALSEARRISRPGGLVFAVGISRFASTLAGLAEGYLTDPEFARIAEQDLRDGQHRNPTLHDAYFTTAFFHRPDELESEVRSAGLHPEQIVAVEGPAWLLQNFDEHWRDPARRAQLLDVIRSIESEPSLIGASAHMLVVGRRRE